MNVSPRERRLLALLALAVGAAVLRLVWLVATPDAGTGTRASARNRGGRAARVAVRALPETLEVVRTEALEIAPRELAIGRDLFRFGPPPPPPPPSPEELERQRREAEARRRLAELAAQEAAIPRPPPVTVRFLGSFGPEGRRLAVFASSDGEKVLNVAEGEQVEGKFVVVKIGYESVDLGFVGFPDAAARRLGLSD